MSIATLWLAQERSSGDQMEVAAQQKCHQCNGVGLVMDGLNHRYCGLCQGSGTVLTYKGTFGADATNKETTLTLEMVVWANTYAQAFAYLKLKDANGSKPNSAHADIATRVANEAVEEYRKRKS